MATARALFDPRMNSAPQAFDLARDLDPGFLDFFLPLHRRFTPWQQKLVAKRAAALAEAHGGRLLHG